MDGAFVEWMPIRHAQRDRTHSEPIGDRAQADRAALKPLPELPYLAWDLIMGVRTISPFRLMGQGDVPPHRRAHGDMASGT